MPIEFEVIDRRGYRIVCTKETWRRKTRKRPWMNSEEVIDIIKRTIEEPTMPLFKDADYDDRQVYYRRTNMRGKYMKVVVAFDDKGNGEIITATPTNNGKPGEKLL